MVTEKFKHTALSFAGCDGGNLNSDVWFCGLEWGGSQRNELDPAVDRDNLYSWSDEDFIGSWTAQYNQKICWFLWYFFNLEWHHGENSTTFVKRHHILYSEKEDGIGFKMNMLPIGFPNRNQIDWNETLQSLTGLSTFDKYREWCVVNRGEFFRKQILTYRPSVIVCTGISEVNNFVRFFTGRSTSIYSSNPSLKIAYAQFEDTLICICPFFGGASGINSYEKMEILVKDIQGKLTCK